MTRTLAVRIFRVMEAALGVFGVARETKQDDELSLYALEKVFYKNLFSLEIYASDFNDKRPFLRICENCTNILSHNSQKEKLYGA